MLPQFRPAVAGALRWLSVTLTGVWAAWQPEPGTGLCVVRAWYRRCPGAVPPDGALSQAHSPQPQST